MRQINQVAEQDAKLLGKCVKLNEPYRPKEEVYDRGKDWAGFEFGIIVEVISHEIDYDAAIS